MAHGWPPHTVANCKAFQQRTWLNAVQEAMAMEPRPPHEDDMEDMPTPQELSNELHAVEEAVAAVERDERDQLLQPWTHTPLPGTQPHIVAFHDGYSAAGQTKTGQAMTPLLHGWQFS